jgi:hypothetical protein
MPIATTMWLRTTPCSAGWRGDEVTLRGVVMVWSWPLGALRRPESRLGFAPVEFCSSS